MESKKGELSFCNILVEIASVEWMMLFMLKTLL